MFRGRLPLTLPGQSGFSKAITFFLMAILLGALVLGLILSEGSIDTEQAEGEVLREVKKPESSTVGCRGGFDKSLIILLLVAYIVGLISAMTILTPRYYG